VGSVTGGIVVTGGWVVGVVVTGGWVVVGVVGLVTGSGTVGVVTGGGSERLVAGDVVSIMTGQMSAKSMPMVTNGFRSDQRYHRAVCPGDRSSECSGVVGAKDVSLPGVSAGGGNGAGPAMPTGPAPLSWWDDSEVVAVIGV